MSPLALLVAFSGFVLAATLWIARRDVIFAGFFLFFFVYTIFAMIGYELYPVVSWALNMYYGRAVYLQFYQFIFLSFASFLFFFIILAPRLVRPNRFAVRYRPSLRAKFVFLFGAVTYLIWMTVVFARDYGRIGYAFDPQIPDFLFSIGFKEMPIVGLVLFAELRRYARGATERVLVGCTLVWCLCLFALIAARAGSRTDVLALLLGVAFYELYPLYCTRTGGLVLRPTRARLRALVSVTLAMVLGVVMMFRIQATREQEATGLPTYATVLYNDYYTPAHMLLSAMAYGDVQPREVLRSNAANAFFLGRVPYLQTELGNLVRPGSSSRRASFGYYIFTEGYMALGRWGFLYNGLVPLLGIALWRLLSSSTDRQFNAFGAALAAMFFANVTRTQSMLLVRDFYFFLLPGMVLFLLVSGARPARRVPLASAKVIRVKSTL